MTLIEMVVTIALMTVGVVGIVAAFANAERITTISQNDAQTQTTLRTIVDALRSSVAYQPCDSSSGALYTAALSGMYPSSDTLTLSVMRPDGTLTTWGSTSTQLLMSPRADCGTTVPRSTTVQNYPPSCPSGDTCDWGLQRITVSLKTPGGPTLQQVVFVGAKT